jgi:hypothetical protein
MTVTFTLSPIYTGATYVAGPFNIFAVTNTGSSTQVGTGITKAQLATGHTISGISDATTGGTITSTGVCTNSYPWYVDTPEPTSSIVELQVYGKDENLTPQNALISYTVNGGSPVEMMNLEPLPMNCGLLYTISDLVLGDVVEITSVSSYPMSGVGSSTCPTLTGTNTTYTHTIGISSGVDYVALTINSNVSV